jgi:hypothetical protein
MRRKRGGIEVGYWDGKMQAYGLHILAGKPDRLRACVPYDSTALDLLNNFQIFDEKIKIEWNTN